MRSFIALLLISLMLLMVSCKSSSEESGIPESGGEDTAGGTVDENAMNVVVEFVNQLKNIRDQHPDVDLATCGNSNNPLTKAIEQIIGDYYYFDDSTEDYPEESGSVKLTVSRIICSDIDELKETDVRGVGPTEEPYNVPKELENVQAIAPVRFKLPSAPDESERYTVKIDGKWYIRAIYVVGMEIHFYVYDDIFF